MTRNSSQNLQEILERRCRLFLQESFRKPFLSVLYIWIDFFIVQNLSVLFPYPRSHINRLVISRIVRLLIRWRACPFYSRSEYTAPPAHFFRSICLFATSSESRRSFWNLSLKTFGSPLSKSAPHILLLATTNAESIAAPRL